MTTPTVFEWAGGAEAFLRLTEVFYDKVLDDPILAPVFAHMSDKHREHVALWLGRGLRRPEPLHRRARRLPGDAVATT